MNLHEYQAKLLFADFNLPTPKGIVINDISEVPSALEKLAGEKWVVKAQIHAGGRGKAGGVQVVNSPKQAIEACKNLLGSRLATFQTDQKGLPVNNVLIEQAATIKQELYLGATIDRSSQRIAIIASTQGGMDIEKVAADTPEQIVKIIINPVSGIMPFQIRKLAYRLGLNAKLVQDFTKILKNLLYLFKSKDLSLIEINPLIITEDDELICLDAKINIDSNSLYRQPDLANIHDLSQEDAREVKANAHGLSYISLNGNVGCMVNGAGLAMATMDLIKIHNGKPANFLDVGGGTTAAQVAVALNIILSDKNVKSVLVNIFGGIVRCDLIADGLIEAISNISTPIVIRLEGNNKTLGLSKLKQSGLNLIVTDSLDVAVQKAIALANK